MGNFIIQSNRIDATLLKIPISKREGKKKCLLTSNDAVLPANGWKPY